MRVYINKKEYDALYEAWDQINAALESCSDEDAAERMEKILNGLSSITDKYKSTKFFTNQ